LNLDGEPVCDAQLLKKCSRCSALHKPCAPFPVEFNSKFNSLQRARERVPADADAESEEVTAWTTAKREFVAELDAFGRKKAKFGGTHKPKGDEIAMLLVGSVNRAATALEGLLDLARSAVGLFPVATPSL
jgi:hypothetical protein